VTSRWAAFACLTAAYLLASGAGTAQSQNQVAILQGLDKVTARISTIPAPIGQPVRFGALEIVVRACRKRPPEEPPESAALLEVRELKPSEAPAELFRGWMFASSPALSALEHPIYDVWVLDCRQASSSAAPSSIGKLASAASADRSLSR
jgi:hypothetical protein